MWCRSFTALFFSVGPLVAQFPPPALLEDLPRRASQEVIQVAQDSVFCDFVARPTNPCVRSPEQTLRAEFLSQAAAGFNRYDKGGILWVVRSLPAPGTSSTLTQLKEVWLIDPQGNGSRFARAPYDVACVQISSNQFLETSRDYRNHSYNPASAVDSLYILTTVGSTLYTLAQGATGGCFYRADVSPVGIRFNCTSCRFQPEYTGYTSTTHYTTALIRIRP